MGLKNIQADVGEVVSKDFEYDLVRLVFITLGFFRQFSPETPGVLVSFPAKWASYLSGSMLKRPP